VNYYRNKYTLFITIRAYMCVQFVSEQSFAPVMHNIKLVRSWKLRPNDQLSECTRRLFTWDFSRRLHPFAPNGSLARQLVNLLKRAQGRSAFVGTQPPTAASHIHTHPYAHRSERVFLFGCVRADVREVRNNGCESTRVMQQTVNY
jgi:hypothetical protein